ncbi:unnamed protein product [Linum tenue]|uniref:Maspardin n=1 Tax=Linum tenue TaxID=586396 RepID=A0AAV0R2B4_9ROSI|nr:unnamed protein product [Linum tenue]
MKGVLAAPGDYVHFKSQVPLHKIPGYRVISIDIPRVWNHIEWIQEFDKFLDVIHVHHMHLYGTSLGGFLAQIFAQHRPRRVRSLVLSNTFLDNRSFAAAMPWAPLLESKFMNLLLKDCHFLMVETLSKDDLASRLTLNVDATSVGSLLLSDQFITIMDGTGGSRSREKDEKEEDDRDGQSKDGGNSAESSSSGSDPLPLPPPESSESQSTCTSVDELLNKAVLTARRYDAAEAFAHHLVASCVGYVYICLNYGSDFRQMLM